jgi:hypothetical protein
MTLNTPPNWDSKSIDLETMNLKGKDYLQVANRIEWFIAEQRYLFLNNELLNSYKIEVLDKKIDLEREVAIFIVRVTDCLGNSVEDVGSESRKDFNDYIEKAYKKAYGRCLVSLGYSTNAALDYGTEETESGDMRVVDAPVKPNPKTNNSKPQNKEVNKATSNPQGKATPEQIEELKVCYPDQKLWPRFPNLSYASAEQRIKDAKGE